jgi:hypothetical protein
MSCALHLQVRDFVYIDPKWIIDAFKGLIRPNRNSLLAFFVSDKVTLSDDERNSWLVRIRRLTAFGILHKELIPFLWPGGLEGLSQTYWMWVRSQKEGDLWPRPVASDQKDYDRVLEFLESSDMLNPVNEFEYVAPALLAGPNSHILDPRAFEPPLGDTVRKSISVACLPDGFFNKLLVKLRRRNNHMDFSAFGAALYRSGLKTQVFLTHSNIETHAAIRKRSRVTLHMFTTTKKQMEEIMQYLGELFKFFPGMYGINKDGTVYTLEAHSVWKFTDFLSGRANASKHGDGPTQVTILQAASVDVGDVVEIRELRVLDEEENSAKTRWKLPVGASGLRFEAVSTSKDDSLIYLKPPDQIRDAMSRQFKQELQDQMEKKQKQDQILKMLTGRIENAKGDIDALKLQITRLKTGSLLLPKANLSARVVLPNTHLNQGPADRKILYLYPCTQMSVCFPCMLRRCLTLAPCFDTQTQGT